MPISINISFKTNVIICFSACDFPLARRITGECRGWLCLAQDDVTALVSIINHYPSMAFLQAPHDFKGQAKAWRGNSLHDIRMFLFP